MTHKLREVRVEESAYYVNKLRQILVWKDECDVTKSEQQIQMTTICHWYNPPWKFSAYATATGAANTAHNKCCAAQ